VVPFEATFCGSNSRSYPTTLTSTASNRSSKQPSTSILTIHSSGNKFTMLSLHPPHLPNRLPLPSNEPLLKAFRFPSTARQLSVPHRRFKARSRPRRYWTRRSCTSLEVVSFEVWTGFLKNTSRDNHGPSGAKAFTSRSSQDMSTGDGPTFPILRHRMTSGHGWFNFRTTSSSMHQPPTTARRAPAA